jgi:hypothetical protein
MTDRSVILGNPDPAVKRFRARPRRGAVVIRLRARQEVLSNVV